MATIQTRSRFEAKVMKNRSVLGKRTFEKESDARKWLREQVRSLEADGESADSIEPKVAQRTSHRVMVRLKGFPAQSATFARKSDAKRWAEQTQTAIRNGEYFKTAEAKKHTLAELIERYEAEVLSQKTEAQSRDQKRHLKWWKDEIGAFKLSQVTPALIAEQKGRLATGLTVRKRQRSPSTVNRYLTSLSHLFTVAVNEWEWVDTNPVRKVRKLKEPRGRVRILSDTERAALLEVCKSSEDRRLYPLVVLALSTGARSGELLSLRWPDVDLERGAAVVHNTKNNERRSLPVTGFALEQLRDFGRVRRLDTDLVFADDQGKPLFPRTAWEEALEASNVNDFRFHDLRHSAASYLAMNGATLAEIAEVLGHKTLAMVKRYSHLTEQHTSKVVARMNEQIFGDSSG